MLLSASEAASATVTTRPGVPVSTTTSPPAVTVPPDLSLTTPLSSTTGTASPSVVTPEFGSSPRMPTIVSMAAVALMTLPTPPSSSTLRTSYRSLLRSSPAIRLTALALS